jgi:hypothetical protein
MQRPFLYLFSALLLMGLSHEEPFHIMSAIFPNNPVQFYCVNAGGNLYANSDAVDLFPCAPISQQFWYVTII